jgi:hypothetical protein
MSKAMGRIITSLRRLNPVRCLRVANTRSPMVGDRKSKETSMTRHQVMSDVVAKVSATAAMNMRTPDPIYDLIDAHRHAVDAYNKSSAPDDSPEQTALAKALDAATNDLHHPASTVQGCEALILYAARQPSLLGQLEEFASEFSIFLNKGGRHQQPQPSIPARGQSASALQNIANWQPQDIPKVGFEATLAANTKNVSGLVALYDAYQAAADAILLLENQPRAADVEDFLSDEASRFKEAAQRVGAVLAAMPEVKRDDAERRATTLFNCALDMGLELDRATKVLMEATTTPQVA